MKARTVLTKRLDFFTAQQSSKNQAACWLVSWENGKFNRGENEALGRRMEQSGKHLKCLCPRARSVRAKQEECKALVHIPSYECQLPRHMEKRK